MQKRLTKMTVIQLSKGLKDTLFSSDEVTRAYIDNIHERENKIQAFITINEDEAIERAKELWPYGSRILLANFLDTLSTQMRSLVIGKSYSNRDLAYYNRGDTYPQLVLSSINHPFHIVLFPYLRFFGRFCVWMTNYTTQTLYALISPSLTPNF